MSRVSFTGLIGVDFDIGIILKHSLDHLIRASDVLKAVKRDGILYSRVVRIEGDEVGNTHIDELLKRKSTVERLSTGSLMLSALVEHGHNYADPSCLTAYCADNTLKILEMVVGTHRYGLTVHLVLDTVIENVAYNVNVVTT